MIDTTKSVLVAGAGGFIGGHFIQALLKAGIGRIRAVDCKVPDNWFQQFPQVECLQLDLKEKDACQIATRDMDVVYNFACNMGGMGFIENFKAECMLSVLINTHLLMGARDNGVGRYFYASSACVYNGSKQERTDVTALTEDDAYPALAEDGYGWEKLFSERMCRHFSEDFNLTTRVARFHNVYGPQGTFDGGREKAPAAISRKIAQAKLSGQHEIEIWGDGEQTRSFMYIDDCVNGINRIMSSETCTFPINLGSDELVSINQLVSMIEQIAGLTVKRRYNLDAPKGVRGRNSDNTLIQKTLGWAPSITLQSGLEKTYAWIYDQLASGRPEQRFMMF